ncbi:MAG: restriction endonuclease subunit S [Flavobacteriales bacterium]|nr:restriction endonuclease subunit S [Flavobacteriales bacterium]
MPQNWKTYKLVEVGKIITGKTPSAKNPEHFGNELPFVTPTDFKNYVKNVSFAERNISKEGVIALKTKILPIDSIIVTCIGSDMGKVVLNQIPCLTNQQINSIVPDKSIVNPHFLYYKIVSEYSTLRTLATGGSTMPILNKSEFENIEISLPPLPEQRAIASILSALDDKIELNLQMNKTLEDMAMALYKHWFVDFGPFKDGTFVESELGMIPEGWEVKSIGEVIETIGGGTPKTNVPEYWENGEIDWYSPTDLTSSNTLFSLGTAKKITKLGLQKSSSRLLPPGSLLMSSRATIGALTITRKEACTNQGFISMIPNEIVSIYQLHGWTKYNSDLILSKANGSTFKEISKSEFRALPISIGNNIESFELQSKSIYNLIENNILETQTLKEQRDSLLPKLISEEIKLKDQKIY